MSLSPRGPPIDRGWAWVIMTAVFVNLMFCIGFVRSFGILFMEFQNRYHASSSVTALIMGIQGGVLSISGFLAQNVLTTYISVRVTVMLGGLLSSVGVILSVFANSIPLLVVTQSLLIGCGNGFIISPGLVLLGKYFNKHRSLAIAVAQTGANIGAIAMPPLIRYLLDEFGLSGVFLIYGALMLHIVASGALLRPIESYKCKTVVQNETIGCDTNGELEPTKEKSTSGITAPEEDILISENETEKDKYARSRTTSASRRTFKNFMETISESSAVKYTSTPDLACLSIQDIPSSADGTVTEKDQDCRQWLEKTLDFSLFRKALFYLLMAIAMFGVVAGAMMGIYIPVLGKDKNATNREATAMLSANGAAGAFSRIAVGFFADRGIMKRNHILSLALFIAGVTAILSPLYHGFGSLIAFSLINGFFSSLYFSLIPVITVDFLGLEKLAKTFGFIQLVHGASAAACHPIAGMLRDVRASFDVPYIFFGVSSLVSCSLLMFEPCARRFDHRKSQFTSPAQSEDNLSLTECDKRV